MIVHKLINQTLLSKINPYYINKSGINTYGLGSYYSGNEEYIKDYQNCNSNFAIKLTIEMDSDNYYIIPEKNLPEDSFDNLIFIQEFLDFIPCETVTQNLSNYDYILIENEKEIVVIPENRRPSLKILQIELITFNNSLKEKLKGINFQNIGSDQFDAIDTILINYI